MRIRGRLAGITLATILCLATSVRGSAQPDQEGIPPEYRTTYKQLDAALDRFASQLKPAKPGNVAFGVSVLTFNSNMGERLLQPRTTATTRQFLDRLRELGIKAVQLDIQFPTFYSAYYTSPQERQAYIDVYKKVAAEIRKRGFIFCVESQVVFSQPAWSTMPVKSLYDRLSFDEYKKGRLETLQVIVRELEPDFLTVGNEPSTEAALTGQPLTDPKRYADMMAYFIGSLRRSETRKTRIGAGLGSWEKDYRELARRYTEIPGLDLINIHVYPVNGELLQRAYEIAKMAKAHGKKLVIGEMGLYKLTDKDIASPQGIAGSVEIYARDTFGFWAPLDAKFLNVMARFAGEFDMAYVSFFWSRSLFAYLDYDEVKDLPPTGRMSALNRAAAANIAAGRFSPLGRAYQRIIAGEDADHPR